MPGLSRTPTPPPALARGGQGWRTLGRAGGPVDRQYRAEYPGRDGGAVRITQGDRETRRVRGVRGVRDRIVVRVGPGQPEARRRGGILKKEDQV